MKLKSFLAGILLLCSGVLSAQDWIDVTDAYVANPRFDGNSVEGWTLGGDAPTKATGYDGFEFFGGTFDIHQTLRVPAGKYRLSVQAYFRYTDNNRAYSAYKQGSDPKTAFLYANEVSQPVVSIYKESLGYYVSGAWNNDGVHYFPNNMESGSTFFAQGFYQNATSWKIKFALMLIIGYTLYLFPTKRKAKP